MSGLPTKWKNYIIRFVFTWLMIGGFGLIIYGGPLALMITVFCVQVKVVLKHLFLAHNFFDILSLCLVLLGDHQHRIRRLQIGQLAMVSVTVLVRDYHIIISCVSFAKKNCSRYFLVTSNYFFYGETLVEQFGVVINSGPNFLPVLVRYHRCCSVSAQRFVQSCNLLLPSLLLKESVVGLFCPAIISFLPLSG